MKVIKSKKKDIGGYQPNDDFKAINPPKQIDNLVKDEEKKTIESFLSNKENKQKAAEIAHQIQSHFSGWFTIPRIVEKFEVETLEAAKRVEALMMFDMCVGKVEKNIAMFKIDLDHKTQRELLLEEIKETKAKLSSLLEKLSFLD